MSWWSKNWGWHIVRFGKFRLAKILCFWVADSFESSLYITITLLRTNHDTNTTVMWRARKQSAFNHGLFILAYQLSPCIEQLFAKVFILLSISFHPVWNRVWHFEPSLRESNFLEDLLFFTFIILFQKVCCQNICMCKTSHQWMSGTKLMVLFWSKWGGSKECHLL